MVVEVTRHIKRPVERELWARAAARCQFSGCNKLLYKSAVTQESVNVSQNAHIYAFSDLISWDSPRTYTLCEPRPIVLKYPFSTSKLRSSSALFFKSPVILL